MDTRAELTVVVCFARLLAFSAERRTPPFNILAVLTAMILFTIFSHVAMPQAAEAAILFEGQFEYLGWRGDVFGGRCRPEW